MLPAESISSSSRVEHSKYWAFISYSHKDFEIAKWLHGALESYRIPPSFVGRVVSGRRIPTRLFPIFKDREEFPASADLGEAVKKALNQSRTLIVVCSPEAAASHWVNEEVRFFQASDRIADVLCLIAKGEPNASSPEQECLPEPLRLRTDAHDLRRAPLAADLREGRDSKSDVKLKIVAGILGLGLDDLRQREKRRKRKRFAATIAALLLSSTILAAFFLWQERQIDKERWAAAVEQGRQHLLEGRPDEALPLLQKTFRDQPDSLVGRYLLARTFGFSSVAEYEGRLLSFSPQGGSAIVGKQIVDTTTWTPAVDLNGYLDSLYYQNTLYGVTTKLAPFSADGNSVIGKTEDLSLAVWEVKTGRLLFELAGMQDDARYAEFGRAGKYILTVGRMLQLWNAHNGEEIKHFPNGDRVRYATLSSDESKLLAITYHSDLLIWDVESEEPLLALTEEAQVVCCSVSFSPDAATIATLHQGGIVQVRDLDRVGSQGSPGSTPGARLLEISTKDDDVPLVEFSPDGKMLLTAGRAARLWDAKSGALIRTLEEREQPLLVAAFSPDGRSVVTLEALNDWVRLWEVETGALLMVESTGLQFGNEAFTVSFSPESRFLSLSTDDYCKIWDTSSRWLKVGSFSASVGEFSRDGDLIALGRRDGVVELRSADSGMAQSSQNLHTSTVEHVHFCEGNKTIVSIANDGLLVILSTAGETLHSVRLDPSVERTLFRVDQACSVVLAERSDHSEGFELAFFSMSSGRQIPEMPLLGGGFRVLDAAFSLDDSRVVVLRDLFGTQINQWLAEVTEIKEGTDWKDMELPGEGDAVVFHPDGNRVLIAAGELLDWNLLTDGLASFHGASGIRSKPSFVRGGEILATAREGGQVEIWDALEHRLLSATNVNVDQIVSVALSPEGTRLLVFSSKERVDLWRLPEYDVSDLEERLGRMNN